MVEIKKNEKRKDHFKLWIGGKYVGEFERSDYRHIVEVIDDAINVGL